MAFNIPTVINTTQFIGRSTESSHMSLDTSSQGIFIPSPINHRVRPAAAPLVIRPNKGGGVPGEVYDADAVHYVNDMRPGGKKQYTFTDLLGNTIDRAFENAPPASSSESSWTMAPRKTKPAKQEAYPALSGKVPVYPTAKWGPGMVSLSKKAIADDQEHVQARNSFKERELEYIKKIERLEHDLEVRGKILDEMDLEIDSLHRELSFYRDSPEN